MEKINNFIEFIEALRCEVSKQDGREFESQTRVKTNSGVRVCLLTVEKKPIMPCIYIEGFYNRYQEGYTLERLAEDFLSIYKCVEKDTVDKKILKDLSKYEFIKERVCYFYIVSKYPVI